jgi:hypothetical protein
MVFCTATTLRPIAPSFATFLVLARWMPAAAGSSFALPPAEAGIHPSDGEKRSQVHGGRQLLGSVLYLMCDDLPALMKSLKAKGVSCSTVEEEDWGIKTTIQLPSGSEIGLYQPTHPTALGLK